MENPTNRNLHRRQVIAGIGSVSTIAIAGCAGDGDESADTRSDDTETDSNDEVDPDDDEGDSNDGAESEYIDEVDDQVTLSYGETASLSNGTQITAHDFEFETSLGQFSEADEGMHFALLYLRGENTGSSAERLPQPWFDFSVLHNSSQTNADHGFGMEDYDEFEGGEIQPGIVREGYVVFEVPSDLDQSNLDTIWFDDFLGTSIDVRWTDE